VRAARSQDHMKGRRHARRLQYIRNMPEEQRKNHLERIASGAASAPARRSNTLSLTARLGLWCGEEGLLRATRSRLEQHRREDNAPAPRVTPARAARAGEWGGRLARRDSGGRAGLDTCLPSLRIGAYNLPSSMDLRTFLEDMQARAAPPPNAWLGLGKLNLPLCRARPEGVPWAWSQTGARPGASLAAEARGACRRGRLWAAVMQRSAVPMHACMRRGREPGVCGGCLR